MIERIVLPNGIRILMEEMPTIQTVSVGVWIDTGSSHEVRGELGLAHYMEHMLFKGTVGDSRSGRPPLSAKTLAETFDALGGQVNAFTAKEYTCFYTKVLDEDLYEALGLLSDMVQYPMLSEADIQNERGVILEEYAMYEDSPEDLVSDQLFEAVWAGTPLGTNILGTPSGLKRVTAERLRKFLRKNYTPQHMVLSVCGAVDRAAFLAEVERLFGGHSGKRSRRSPIRVPFLPSVVLREKEAEQSHLCIGFEGLPYGHPDSSILTALNNIVGNGMSSRLFQRVREELGLVYSIYSFLTPHRESGLWGVCAACQHNVQKEAIQAILEELWKVTKQGVTEQEIRDTKRLMRTNLIMGFESPYARMSHMAKGELFNGEILSQEALLEQVDAITPERVNALAVSLLRPDVLSISVVGKQLPREYYEGLRQSR